MKLQTAQSTAPRTLRWTHLIWWVIASFVGGMFGSDLGLLLGGLQNLAFYAVVLCMLVGLGQALLLRLLLPEVRRWFVASLLGAVLGGVALVLAGPPVSRMLVDVALALGLTNWLPPLFIAQSATWGLFMLCYSAAQWWLVLRHYGRLSLCWVPACVLAAGIAVTLGVDMLYGAQIVAGAILGSAIYGALTGVVLIWLVNRDRVGG
ncbi:MAG: hypothetical protein MUD01_19590 [Chloroflexaceae bacterium]|jgi:hypothetical protein|nr:hypothetical protein [Chloroflexaceae bacterium]